jgi:hypothetical protein
MDQFLQPKELVEELRRNPWPEHDQCHDSIDQILDLGHAPLSVFQRLLNVPVALIAHSNVNGQVFFGIRHWVSQEQWEQRVGPVLLFALLGSIEILLGMVVFQGMP